MTQAETGVKEAQVNFAGNLRGISETTRPGDVLTLVIRPQEAVAALDHSTGRTAAISPPSMITIKRVSPVPCPGIPGQYSGVRTPDRPDIAGGHEPTGRDANDQQPLILSPGPLPPRRGCFEPIRASPVDMIPPGAENGKRFEISRRPGIRLKNRTAVGSRIRAGAVPGLLARSRLGRRSKPQSGAKRPTSLANRSTA